jgi:hypothetical protein
VSSSREREREREGERERGERVRESVCLWERNAVKRKQTHNLHFMNANQEETRVGFGSTQGMNKIYPKHIC